MPVKFAPSLICIHDHHHCVQKPVFVGVEFSFTGWDNDMVGSTLLTWLYRNPTLD